MNGQHARYDATGGPAPERELRQRPLESEDAREGLAAYVEKR